MHKFGVDSSFRSKPRAWLVDSRTVALALLIVFTWFGCITWIVVQMEHGNHPAPPSSPQQ
jgi:hypothetical protein